LSEDFDAFYVEPLVYKEEYHIYIPEGFTYNEMASRSLPTIFVYNGTVFCFWVELYMGSSGYLEEQRCKAYGNSIEWKLVTKNIVKHNSSWHEAIGLEKRNGTWALGNFVARPGS
jgi:hypothetical protein